MRYSEQIRGLCPVLGGFDLAAEEKLNISAPLYIGRTYNSDYRSFCGSIRTYDKSNKLLYAEGNDVRTTDEFHVLVYSDISKVYP